MSRPGSTVSYARNEHLNTALYAASPAPEPAIASHSSMSHQEEMERFTTILRDLESLIIQLPIQSLAALPPNHDLRHLVRQILFVAANSMDHNRTPLHMSQKILCRSFEDVAKEAITWPLLYAEDERKLNIPVTVTLLRSGFISTSLQDQQLAKNLFTDLRPSLQNFAAGLICECLSSDPAVASQSQLAFSIEVLGQLAQAGDANEGVIRILDDVRVPSSQKPSSSKKSFSQSQQWVFIFQRSQSPEKAFGVPFISQLTKQ
ncbi:hypothetical protein DEU56DRAFT_913074 [Suillus clintonianus]|uniref:uncharacterized protein n=1 Tax=Suillus clintonianus TaxID=1904413 RepID=UPI001B87661A|nr:uncharacterized protein DEU56DRAFT_913074 [Suillus clintonianus]KAG2135984.1 hypothetical protein DEU56DRAFT_913074 [Suillus clintonianus]